MDMLAVMRRRYTAKSYSGERIPEEKIAELLEIVRLAPSSLNFQPWKFIVGGSDAARAAMLEMVAPFNRPRIEGCSHFVVVAARTDLTDAYLESVIAREAADGRFATEQEREARLAHCRALAQNIVRRSGIPVWAQNQAHLALGVLLVGAASLGIDATPIGAADFGRIDGAYGLAGQGLRSVVVVSLGRGSPADANARLPKSRLAADDVFAFV